MDNAERKSPNLSLSTFRVPRYRYFPTNLLKQYGPEQWGRLRILQACERLEIPVKQWPKISFPGLPNRPIGVRSYIPRHKIEQLDFPPFQPLEETLAEWRGRCHETLDVLLAEYSKKFEVIFQYMVKQGIHTKIPQTRSTTDINLRYEWAAQRLCYRTPYKKLADSAKGYSVERVKQSVNQILKKAGLNEGI
jgi:hypothetical protein